MQRNVSGCNEEVLIVDDDRSVHQILAKILRRAGCIVTTAESGQEALRKLETQTYDVAVIDVRLQDMNGLDLLEQMEATAPNMTKIILTGYPSDEDKTRAMELGVDYYLAKPIKSETLVEIVESVSKKKAQSTKDQPDRTDSYFVGHT